MREEVANTKKLGNKGFSLIELIIVIAIMAILIGIVGTQVVPYIEKSKQAKDKQVLSSLLTNATTAFADNAGILDDTKGYVFSIGTAATGAGGTDATDPGDKVKDDFYELAGLTKTTPDGGSTPTVDISAIKSKMSSKAGNDIKGITIARDASGKVTVTTTLDSSSKYSHVFEELSST